MERKLLGSCVVCVEGFMFKVAKGDMGKFANVRWRTIDETAPYAWHAYIYGQLSV